MKITAYGDDFEVAESELFSLLPNEAMDRDLYVEAELDEMFSLISDDNIEIVGLENLAFDSEIHRYIHQLHEKSIWNRLA